MLNMKKKREQRKKQRSNLIRIICFCCCCFSLFFSFVVVLCGQRIFFVCFRFFCVCLLAYEQCSSESPYTPIAHRYCLGHCYSVDKWKMNICLRAQHKSMPLYNSKRAFVTYNLKDTSGARPLSFQISPVHGFVIKQRHSLNTNSW